MFQGFRPVRERSRLVSNYKEIIEQLKKLKAFRNFPEEPVSAIFLFYCFPFGSDKRISKLSFMDIIRDVRPIFAIFRGLFFYTNFILFPPFLNPCYL